MTIELNEGEIYVGAIIGPDGNGNHIILLPGDNDDADWKTQMEWAKSIGGDLPDRVELALLYKRHPEQFKKDAYWSNEEHASASDYAWYQYFFNGYQYCSSKDIMLRARAVRRLVI
ncbi:MAG: hypothetical protein PHW66_06290 [Gallionella sp.]|nr:hypothetical protein [Gallionella sp.]